MPPNSTVSQPRLLSLPEYMHCSRSCPSKLLTYIYMPLLPSVHWMKFSFFIDLFTQPALQVWIQTSRTSVLRKHLSCSIFFFCLWISPSISCDNSLWQALVTFTRIYALFLYYTSLEFEPIYFCICIKGCFTCMLVCFHMCEYTCLNVQVRVHKCTCLKA